MKMTFLQFQDVISKTADWLSFVIFQFLDVILDVYLSFYPLISSLGNDARKEMQEQQEGEFVSWYLLANSILISTLSCQYDTIIKASSVTKLLAILREVYGVSFYVTRLKGKM